MGDKISYLYDKYDVREYVKKTVGEEYLPQLYGIYNNVSEININELPDKFVAKITQSCGKNIIVNGTIDLDFAKLIKQLDEWQKETFNKAAISGHKEESYFNNGKAKILFEEYLDAGNNNSPEDIRIYCFNGKAKFISVDYDSVTEKGEKKKSYLRNIFSLNGDFLEFKFGRDNDYTKTELNIGNLDKLIEVAEALAEPFPFVRVDMYELNNSIKFGELTWIPMGGNCFITPKEIDNKLGNILKLPSVDIDYKLLKRKLIRREL